MTYGSLLKASCKVCGREIAIRKGRGCYPLYSHIRIHPEENAKAMSEKIKWLEANKKLGNYEHPATYLPLNVQLRTEPPIWNSYKKHQINGYAICKICEKTITVRKGYGTGPLFSHMKQHPEEYDKAMQEKQQWQEARSAASQLRCTNLGFFFS